MRSRRFVPVSLVAAGLALLIFVGSQYGQMYLEQKHMAERWQQEQEKPSSSAQSADDSLIRLVIPKIDLTSFVVEGTNRHALLLGPGHMIETAEPGELGNAVISGHRDTFFRHIHELERGDQVYVERGGKRLVYEVTGKKIVEPDDISVAGPTKDSELTLITCYPTYYIGPAPKRLVVFTKLLGSHAELKQVVATN
jgi:sortase A